MVSMSLKLVIWSVFLLILCSVVLAQPLEIVVFDPLNGTSFADDIVTYDIYSLNNTILLGGSLVLSENSSFTLDLPEEYLQIEIHHLDSDSRWDYFGKASFTFMKSLTSLKIPFHPNGGIQVIVQSKDKRPLVDAIVRLDCPANSSRQDSHFTDELGEVIITSLPVETCFLRVAYDNYIIRNYVNISQADTLMHLVTFDEIKIKKFNWTYYIILVLFLILALSIIYKSDLMRLFSSQKGKVSVVEPLEKESVSSDVFLSDTSLFHEELISVLNTKEQAVITFMLGKFQSSGQKALPQDFFLSQANIIFGADIPKTSLIRVFTSLETKGLLQIEKRGKSKRVYFGSKFIK